MHFCAGGSSATSCETLRGLLSGAELAWAGSVNEKWPAPAIRAAGHHQQDVAALASSSANPVRPAGLSPRRSTLSLLLVGVEFRPAPECLERVDDEGRAAEILAGAVEARRDDGRQPRAEGGAQAVLRILETETVARRQAEIGQNEVVDFRIRLLGCDVLAGSDAREPADRLCPQGCADQGRDIGAARRLMTTFF